MGYPIITLKQYLSPMSYTLIIILMTAGISAIAFQNEALLNKLILYPRLMDNPSEYYRLLSSGFIHADWPHLIFNMLALYFFGQYVEVFYLDAGLPDSMYLFLYLSAIVAASLPSFMKNRDNNFYRSLGASGGVAAVIFAAIYYQPWAIISVWFVPMPAILFGVLYLAYSVYMTKRGGDYVNHDAHFWGSVYGFLFTSIFDPEHGLSFLSQLSRPSFNL